MNQKRSILVWLASICFLVISMVVIGGITRLTHSGLSMVEWKPIVGMIPPLSEPAWQEVFQKYQQFPEYKLLNQGMTLSEFKWIFFWEYTHRLLGRLIGIVFIFPWLLFMKRGWVDRSTGFKLLGGFFLGGLQGAMGWFMVKSGLVDHPHVSHYRLAAHLILALVVLAYFFWMAAGIYFGSNGEPHSVPLRHSSFERFLRILTGLIVLQIIYGAFTAGLKAGFGFNTFPKMNDEWFPSGFFRDSPWVLNFFENPVAVQFIHRLIGWILVTGVFSFWVYCVRSSRFSLNRLQKVGVHLLLVMVLIQFSLGVGTLLWVVPLSLASLHQLGACILFLIVLFLNYVTFKRPGHYRPMV